MVRFSQDPSLERLGQALARLAGSRLLLKCLAFTAILLIAPTRVAAGPPFITDDPEPVDLNHWEVYIFSAGALEAGNATGTGPALEVNYGVAPGVQLHAIIPAAYDSHRDGTTQFGIGDMELGTKLRVLNPGDDSWLPEIGIFPLLELPSGDARRNLGAGYVQAFLPVWLQKNFGKWTVFGGGGYWINPGPGNENYWFSGVVLQRQIFRNLALGVEVFHQTANLEKRAASTGFNIGAIYDFDEHTHLLLSAGEGELQYAIDAAAVTHPFGYYAALQWTF